MAYFKLLAAKSGFDETSLFSAYKHNLSLEIKRHLIGKEFKDLDDLMHQVAIINYGLHELKPGTTPTRAPGASSGAAQDLNAMEIGPMRADNRWQLTAEERARRREKGLCFKCGRGRHQVRECRSPFNPNPSTPTGARIAAAATGPSSTPPSGAWTPVQHSEALQPDALSLLSQAVDLLARNQEKGKAREENMSAGLGQNTGPSGLLMRPCCKVAATWSGKLVPCPSSIVHLSSKRNHYLSAIKKDLQIHLNLPVTIQGWNRSATTRAMLDSGASTTFLSETFAK